MEPLTINVRVTVEADGKLVNLLSSLLTSPKTAPAVAAEPVAEAPAKPAPTKEKKPVAADPQPEPKPEPAPAEPAPAKEFTEVDVRAAMDRARKRIEGENYKDQPDSEGYKKYHKKLTEWFKKTAKYYGADKPSTLPDHESRAKFIACCEEVAVKDGNVIDDLPF